MAISFSTLFGVIFGVGIVAWGVLSATTNWQIFLSLPSLQIVLGGTLTSAFIGYRWRYIVNALYSILRVFVEQKITPATLVQDVGMVVEWGRQAQRTGLEAFEAIGGESKDEFIQYLCQLVSTGYTKEEVRQFGETTIEESYFRNLSIANILNSMGSTAPAFGMVGTLIGLIVMLSKMDDPSQMGPGLSLALMTTLYGILIARFIFMPCSTKIRQILAIQRFREYLLMEGFLLIMDKRSAFYIQDRLNAFLDRRKRFSLQDAEAK